MWRNAPVFLSAALWAGCSSASSAAPSDDDDSDEILEVARTVTDPGPRGGDRGAGGPYDTLSNDEKTFFTAARDVFSEVDSVSGAIEEGKGLGPTFNGTACFSDGVTQGATTGDMFRTAPLWGVGKRIFFLHDGRSGPANGGLVNAILAHSSRGSEARTTIRRFTQLPAADQQAIVNFLRSL